MTAREYPLSPSISHGLKRLVDRSSPGSFRPHQAPLSVKLFDDALPTGTYSHIFRNEIGIGRMHYSGNVYENFVPALATMEHWEAVQSLHYKRPARGQPHPKDNSHPKAGCGQHLLSGLCRFYRELKKTNLRVDEKLIIRELTEMKNTLGRGELPAR